MKTDTVTGARTEVSLLVDLPIERLWDLVTDVPRYGDWSPECVHAAWLDDAAHRAPRVGDRFTGRNLFGGVVETSVVCVVTELARPESFAWHVLDDSGRPASIWRYALAAGDHAGTLLVHGFEHGPGLTAPRLAAQEDPATLDERLDQIRRNIAVSLDAMLDGTNYREVGTA